METIDPKILLKWRTELLKALLTNNLNSFFANQQQLGLETHSYTFLKTHHLSLEQLFTSYLIAPYGDKTYATYEVFNNKSAFVHNGQKLLSLSPQEFRAMGYSDHIDVALFTLLLTQSLQVKNSPELLGLFLTNYFKPRFVPPFDGSVRKPTDLRETPAQAIVRGLPLWGVCLDLGFTSEHFNKELFKTDDPFLQLLNKHV
jgi:hypothetical protein